MSPLDANWPGNRVGRCLSNVQMLPDSGSAPPSFGGLPSQGGGMRGQHALEIVLRLTALGTLLAMVFYSLQLRTGDEQTAFATGAIGAFLVIVFLAASTWVRR